MAVKFLEAFFTNSKTLNSKPRRVGINRVCTVADSENRPPIPNILVPLPHNFFYRLNRPQYNGSQQVNRNLCMRRGVCLLHILYVEFLTSRYSIDSREIDRPHCRCSRSRYSSSSEHPWTGLLSASGNPKSQSTIQTVMASFGAAEIIASRVAIKFLLPNGITGSLIGSAGAAIKELVSFAWLLILMPIAATRKYEGRSMHLLFLCPFNLPSLSF